MGERTVGGGAGGGAEIGSGLWVPEMEIAGESWELREGSGAGPKKWEGIPTGGGTGPYGRVWGRGTDPIGKVWGSAL